MLSPHEFATLMLPGRPPRPLLRPQDFRNILEEIVMSRESEWVKFALQEEFPPDVEFLEGSVPNHVLVEWPVVGSDDAPRHNAPFVIVINTAVIDRYESSNRQEQTEIASRVRDIVQHRGAHYEASAPVDTVEPVVVEINEGDLQGHPPFCVR